MIEKSTRRPNSGSKAKLFERLENDGYVVTTRGRPDVFAWRENKDGIVEFVVAKARYSANHKLQYYSEAVLKSLAKIGVKVVRYNMNDDIFEQIT